MNISSFTAGLIQMRMQADRESNLKRAVELLEEAAAKGVQVACLPELFLSEYFCREEKAEFFDLAESIPGPTTEKLGEIAAKHKMVIVASIFEKRSAGMYHNTAVIIEADGRLAGIYRKMHIPHDPLFFEKYYFTPGDLGFRVFSTQYGKVGVLVCWDQWFPEAARLTALAGAQVLFYPTAIGWHPAEKAQYGKAQLDAWQTIQRSHGIANGLYVGAANRWGMEGPESAQLQFWGHSFFSDPSGVKIAEAGEEADAILTAAIDPVKIEDTRRNWPFLRDRRIDAYANLTKHPV